MTGARPKSLHRAVGHDRGCHAESELFCVAVSEVREGGVGYLWVTERPAVTEESFTTSAWAVEDCP